MLLLFIHFNNFSTTNQTCSIIILICQPLPLSPINLEGERGEGRGKFFNFVIISVMQWFEGDIKITIMSAVYFSA